jgi:hypothetical protein
VTPAAELRVAHSADLDEGSIHVLPVTAPLDVSRELTCDWREGDAW